MRSVLIIAWLFLPLLAAAYHYGPGQERVQQDEVAALLEQAQAKAEAGEHGLAVIDYEQALRSLPKDDIPSQQQIRLEKAKSQMLASQLPVAHQDLMALVTELQEDKQADEAFMADARATLASAQYYMTWLMRLEGQHRTVWEPEIEASRQNYRLLAEKAKTKKAAEGYQEDLAASIRLARMDLTKLQGLPLPSE